MLKFLCDEGGKNLLPGWIQFVVAKTHVSLYFHVVFSVISNLILVTVSALLHLIAVSLTNFENNYGHIQPELSLFY